MKTLRSLLNKIKNIFKEEDQMMTEKQLDHLYDEKLDKLNNAIANLLFQRSHNLEKKKNLESEMHQLQEDLKEAALSNRDELALHMIAKKEEIEQEWQFLDKQLKELESEIATAKEAKKELELSFKKSRQQIKTLSARHDALQARKLIHKELGEIKNSLGSDYNNKALEQMQTKLLKMEVELNEDSHKELNYDGEIRKLRDSRVKRIHEQTLARFKESLQRQTRTVTPIVVK